MTALKQQSAATAFCQSYLSSVTTSTSTISTVSFNNDPRTCGPPESDNVCPTNNKRRDAAVQTQKPTPKPKPACFSKYTVGQALSSACSCLSVPVSTVTATTTSTNCIPQGRIATPTSFYILPTSGVAAGQYAHVQANGNVSVSILMSRRNRVFPPTSQTPADSFSQVRWRHLRCFCVQAKRCAAERRVRTTTPRRRWRCACRNQD